MTDHIGCAELVELVTDYLEGALPAHEAALFEQHLNVCEGCERYLGQMRATLKAAGAIREDDVPADARERLLGLVRDWRRG